MSVFGAGLVEVWGVSMDPWIRVVIRIKVKTSPLIGLNG